MKNKPVWQLNRLSVTILTVLLIGVFVGVIMAITPTSIRIIGIIILSIFIPGIIATLTISKMRFNKRVATGNENIFYPDQLRCYKWLDSVLKNLKTDAFSFNFNLYKYGITNFSVKLVASETFDEESNDWIKQQIYTSIKNKKFRFTSGSLQQSEIWLSNAISYYIEHGNYADKLKKSEAVACTADNKTTIIYRNFENYLAKFEPFSKLSKILKQTEKDCFSKIGGLPLIPQNFSWPAFHKKPLQLLLQLKFSEINPTGELTNFPTKGLLYVFVDEEAINCSDRYEKGHHFDIVFYEEELPVVESEKPNGLKLLGGFQVDASTMNTYPDSEDCKEADELLDFRPLGGFDDDYEYGFRYDHTGDYQIGGWPLWIQTSNLDADAGWVLFMQIGSDDDDGRMWGDNGNLYFIIKETDSKNNDFSDVRLIMQCY